MSGLLRYWGTAGGPEGGGGVGGVNTGAGGAVYVPAGANDARWRLRKSGSIAAPSATELTHASVTMPIHRGSSASTAVMITRPSAAVASGEGSTTLATSKSRRPSSCATVARPMRYATATATTTAGISTMPMMVIASAIITTARMNGQQKPTTVPTSGRRTNSSRITRTVPGATANAIRLKMPRVARSVYQAVGGPPVSSSVGVGESGSGMVGRFGWMGRIGGMTWPPMCWCLPLLGWLDSLSTDPANDTVLPSTSPLGAM